MARLFLAALVVSTILPGMAGAGDVDVVDVKVSRQADGRYSFSVTLKHEDTGWDHYADAWEVLTPDGRTVLGKRVLYHPHVNEQPFTRSLGNVEIPTGLAEVLVRGHDNVHGYKGKTVRVRLP